MADLPPEMDRSRPLASWFYTSCNLLPGASCAELDRIVEVSRHRNAQLAVTGALVCTASYFIQFIEGPPASIAALKASIMRDPRHDDVRTVSTDALDQRRFADWRLAHASDALEFDHMVGVARTMPGAPGQNLLFEIVRRFADEPHD